MGIGRERSRGGRGGGAGGVMILRFETWDMMLVPCVRGGRRVLVAWGWRKEVREEKGERRFEGRMIILRLVDVRYGWMVRILRRRGNLNRRTLETRDKVGKNQGLEAEICSRL